MGRRPNKGEDVPMEPLNVDIPADLLTAIQVAKALTKKPIREIVREALGAWLKTQGLSTEKVSRIKPK